MTILSCSDEYDIKENIKNDAQKKIALRMAVTKGSSFFNVNIYAYKIQGFDTLFFKSFAYDGYALLNPLELTLDMGEYKLVAIGNVNAEAIQPAANSSISDLLYTLTDHMKNDGTYNPLHELYYGTLNSFIGKVKSDTIKLKHVISKIRINYQHSDPLLSEVSWRLSDLYYGMRMNGIYLLKGTSSVKVQRTYFPPTIIPSVYKDSIYVFPSVDMPTFSLTHKRLEGAVEVIKDYSSPITHMIQPNFITDINVYGGQDVKVNVTKVPIVQDDKYYILDEAPSSAVEVILSGYLPSSKDTINLQSLDLLIDLNQGILSNYLNNFKFTITKIAPLPLPSPSNITKIVNLKIENGKLKTISPIRLSRGTYTLSAYSLNDEEGYLIDPAGKAITKTFVVGLDYQVLNLNLDGRQAEDNELLRQTVAGLHGSTQAAGSVFPGIVKFALEPLGQLFPSPSDGIIPTNWYVDNNAYIEKIPIRGEWRAYNFVYRGINKTPLQGSLIKQITDFKQLILIDLRNNKLTGGLDTFWGNMAQLKTLILSSNLLSGNINNLGPLTKIERLSLEYNNFSEGISIGLTGCASKLFYLSLNNNQFTGDVAVIPSGISNLFIQRNKFTGGAGGKLKFFTVNSATAQWDGRYNYFQCKDAQLTSTSRINPQYVPNTTTTINIQNCP